eukprot:scaffold374296_cov42-Prasinocladus_malaysianus.AAC.1
MGPKGASKANKLGSIVYTFTEFSPQLADAVCYIEAEGHSTFQYRLLHALLPADSEGSNWPSRKQGGSQPATHNE